MTTLVLGALVVGLCGCGGAKSRATSYSVPQVEAAFKAHGLRLHQARFGPATGIVKLLGPGGLEVDFAVKHRGSGTVSWTSFSAGSERDASQRNMIVTWPPRYTGSVNAALRSSPSFR